MKNEPIRVAHVIGKWVGGGVEAVVMNYYRHIDRTKIQFDFICDDDSINIPYEEIEKLGGKVIIISPYQKVIKYHKSLKKVLKDGNYKIVHSHINTLSVFSLFAAKCAKVPIRIAHSHSTTNPKEFTKNIFKQILRPFSKLFANNYMACSSYAGCWLFGKKFNNEGRVLNNAIEIEKFSYDNNSRQEIRKELNVLDDELLIGHVGRFVNQKNHSFLIDIFYDLIQKNDKAKLLLIGQGPLLDEIKLKVKKLKINDKVIFLGQRKDVHKLYNAIDVVIFPSLYEGLGMVAVEAQISGCKCLVSDVIPNEAKISDNIIFLGLKDPVELWTALCKKNENRKNYNKEAQKYGYDIHLEANKLVELYLSFFKGSDL